MFLSVPFAIIPALLIEMRNNGGQLAQAYRTLSNQEGAYPVAVLLVFVTFAGLIWYTFFTKSKKVTDADKLVVFIGTCALALYMVTLAVRSGYL